MTATHGAFAVRQEADTIDSRAIVVAGAVSLAVGIVGVFIAGLLLVVTLGTIRPSAVGRDRPTAVVRTISNVEQTQIWVARTGLDLKSVQQRQLEHWGWADRDAGVATIPIERAIEIVAAETSR